MARQLLAAKRFAEADQALCRHLAATPEDGSALGLRALVLARLERWSEVRELSQTILRTNPESAAAHQAMAESWLAQQRPGRAEEHLQSCLAHEPTAGRWALLGLARLQAGRWPQAREAAEAGLRLEPEHLDCGLTASVALLLQGEVAEAERRLREQLALDPESESLEGMALLLLRQGRFAEAGRLSEQILEIRPESASARALWLVSRKARNPLYAAGFRLAQRLPAAIPGLLLSGLALVAWTLPRVGLEHARVWLVSLPGLLLLSLGLLEPIGLAGLLLDAEARPRLTPGERRAAVAVTVACLAPLAALSVRAELPLVASALLVPMAAHDALRGRDASRWAWLALVMATAAAPAAHLYSAASGLAATLTIFLIGKSIWRD